MPLTILELDKLSLRGEIAVGDLNQNPQVPVWDLIGMPQSRYIRLYEMLQPEIKRFVEEQQRAEHYLSSPLKKFADRICLLSPAERLEEMRNPLSPIRWYYSLFLEYMLLSPKRTTSASANHEVDILHAALDGLEVCVTLCPVEGRWESIASMSSMFGFYVAIKFVLPSLINWKLNKEVDDALQHPVLVANPEASDCSICCETLQLDEVLAVQDVQEKHEWESEWDEMWGKYAALPDFSKFAWDVQPSESLFTCNIQLEFWARTAQNCPASFFKRCDKKGEDNPPNINFPASSSAKLPCSHIFHRGCIRPWLLTNGTCPNCRYITNEVPRPIHIDPEDNDEETDEDDFDEDGWDEDESDGDDPGDDPDVFEADGDEAHVNPNDGVAEYVWLSEESDGDEAEDDAWDGRDEYDPDVFDFR